MHRLSPVLWLALALLCGSLWAQSPVNQASVNWQSDIGAARKAAQQWGAPVLIHFSGDNCLPCKTLEQRVFTRPEVATTMNHYFIPVHINASVDRQTASEFQVHSWPTDVFISPDGKTLSQGVCQQDPNAYLQNLQNIAIMNRDRLIMLAAERQRATLTPTLADAATKPADALQLADKQNPYGLLPAANSAQPPAGNFARSQPNAYALAGQPSGFAHGQSALPPLGQANASSTLANPIANAQSAAINPTARPNDVQRGPVDFQSQPSAITGAASGALQPFSAPNLPQAALAMQSQYTGQTQTGGAAPAWRPQSSYLQSASQMPTSATAVNGMPNMVAAQPQTPQAGQARGALSVQSRGLLVSNPHYPAEAIQEVVQIPPTQTTVASREPTRNPTDVAQAIASSQLPTDAPTSTAKAPVASEQSIEATASSVAIAPNPTAPPLAFQPAAAHSGSAVTEKAAPVEAPAVSPPLAFEGFCPVALITTKEWVAGQEAFAVKHRGRIYHLSSQPAKDAFLAAPDSYEPVLSGYDPMVFLEAGKLVPGSFEFGSIDLQTHTIYLFSSQADKDKFEKSFEDNSKALSILLSRARSSGGQATGSN